MNVLPLICLCAAAFFLTLLFTRLLIPILRRKRLGQFILAVGPSWHKSKEGTPTMGGAVFLLLLPPLVLFGALGMTGEISPLLLFVLLFAVANGLIGVIDDARKLKNKQNLGLLPWQKLILQAIFAGGLIFLVQTVEEKALTLHIPFTNVEARAGLPLFFFLFLLLLGTVNCVNLSDGIDGLATSSSGLIGVFFFAEGLLHGSEELALTGAVLTGCMAAFFVFNRHPARIFMGDTGSLFLGALLAGASCFTGNTAILPVYALLFLIEGASVILQVLVFKRTGKRLFRMAPLHHHLEKCGWGERRIVLVFSAITLVSCLFAHFALL